MANFTGFFAQQVRNVACGYMESATNYYNWANSLYNAAAPGIAPVVYGSGQAQNLRNIACSIGPDPNDPPLPPGTSPREPIGRAGGYCPTAYNMTVVWNYKLYPSGTPTNNPQSGSATVQIVGPVGGFFTDNYPSPELYAINGDGVPVLINGIFNDTLDYGDITSVSFTRVDGSTEECTPAIPGVPSQPPISIPPMTPPAIGLPPITVPIILPGAVTINGELIFNVAFNLGGVTLNGSLNLSTGDVNFNFGGNGNCCEPLIEPPPADGGGPEDPNFNDTDPYVIAGLFVRAIIDPEVKSTRQIAPGSPDVWVPRLGVVQFAYKSGGRSAWGVDIPIKKSIQYVPAEGPIWPVGYSLQEYPGVQFIVDTVRIPRPKL